MTNGSAPLFDDVGELPLAVPVPDAPLVVVAGYAEPRALISNGSEVA
jgi:hypothetical protein